MRNLRFVGFTQLTKSSMQLAIRRCTKMKSIHFVVWSIKVKCFVDRFDKNVLTLDCKKNQSIFHVSTATPAHRPPFKLDSKRLTSPGIAHILAQPWRSQIVWSTSYVEPAEQSAEITLKICLAKHLNSHIWLYGSQDNPAQLWCLSITGSWQLAISNVQGVFFHWASP